MILVAGVAAALVSRTPVGGHLMRWVRETLRLSNVAAPSTFGVALVSVLTGWWLLQLWVLLLSAVATRAILTGVAD